MSRTDVALISPSEPLEKGEKEDKPDVIMPGTLDFDPRPLIQPEPHDSKADEPVDSAKVLEGPHIDEKEPPVTAVKVEENITEKEETSATEAASAVPQRRSSNASAQDANLRQAPAKDSESISRPSDESFVQAKSASVDVDKEEQPSENPLEAAQPVKEATGQEFIEEKTAPPLLPPRNIVDSMKNDQAIVEDATTQSTSEIESKNRPNEPAQDVEVSKTASMLRSALAVTDDEEILSARNKDSPLMRQPSSSSSHYASSEEMFVQPWAGKNDAAPTPPPPSLPPRLPPRWAAGREVSSSLSTPPSATLTSPNELPSGQEANKPRLPPRLINLQPSESTASAMELPKTTPSPREIRSPPLYPTPGDKPTVTSPTSAQITSPPRTASSTGSFFRRNHPPPQSASVTSLHMQKPAVTDPTSPASSSHINHDPTSPKRGSMSPSLMSGSFFGSGVGLAGGTAVAGSGGGGGGGYVNARVAREQEAEKAKANKGIYLKDGYKIVDGVQKKASSSGVYTREWQRSHLACRMAG